MHALIRQGNGKYYVSALFGFYKDITAVDDYERYLESIHKPYWIILDEKKERLIRWRSMEENTKYIIPQMIVVDSDQSDWEVDEEGVGCVKFLTRELIDKILLMDQQPIDILDKCRRIDEEYIYNEISEIKTQADIVNLDWASGGFHDARIAEERLEDDGTLYVRFDGIWGCEIEVWFSGDLKYDTSSRNPEDCDPYWFGATLLLQDGFVYLIDDDDMTVDKIGPGYCYFKARQMKYRIIPN